MPAKRGRPPKLRKAADPNYKLEVEEIQKDIQKMELDFVNMPPEARMLMAYRFRLRGLTIPQIASKMKIGEETARTMVSQVTERMSQESIDLGRQVFSSAFMRLEAVIARMMPTFEMDDDGNYPEFDDKRATVLMQAIKLQAQIAKDILGIGAPLPQTTENHLHIHSNTMDSKSPLYGKTVVEMGGTEIQRVYPEIVAKNAKFANDPRIERLNLLAEKAEADPDDFTATE